MGSTMNSAMVPLTNIQAGNLSAIVQVPGCHEALASIATENHTDLHLAAYCHAFLPPKLCREAQNLLGPQPWSPSRVDSACEKWGPAWKAAQEAHYKKESADVMLVGKSAAMCLEDKAKKGHCKDITKCADQCNPIYSQEGPAGPPEEQNASTKLMQRSVGMEAFYNVATKVPFLALGNGSKPFEFEAKFEEMGVAVPGGGGSLVLPMGLGSCALLGAVAARQLRRCRGSRTCSEVLLE